ncbi:hypothetical protein D3C86_1251920 [compost metagenome]
MTAAKTPRRTGEQQPGGQYETDQVDQQGHPHQPSSNPGGSGFTARDRTIAAVQFAKTAGERLITEQQAHHAEKAGDDPGVDVSRQNHEAHLGWKAVGPHGQQGAKGDQSKADRQLRRYDCA